MAQTFVFVTFQGFLCHQNELESVLPGQYISAVFDCNLNSKHWVQKNLGLNLISTRTHKQNREILLARLIDHVQEHRNKYPSVTRCEGWVGVGYSMGGRVLLELLVRRPDLFDRYIFFSTHPGLQSQEERANRLKQDRKWAQKIRDEECHRFFQEWDSQRVFGNTRSREMPSLAWWEQNRFHLSYLITTLSLGYQAPYQKDLSSLSKPILWIVGEKDKKFVEVSQHFQSCFIKKVLLEDSGHRVHLDHPDRVRALLDRFLSRPNHEI